MTITKHLITISNDLDYDFEDSPSGLSPGKRGGGDESSSHILKVITISRSSGIIGTGRRRSKMACRRINPLKDIGYLTHTRVVYDQLFPLTAQGCAVTVVPVLSPSWRNPGKATPNGTARCLYRGRSRLTNLTAILGVRLPIPPAYCFTTSQYALKQHPRMAV